VATDITQMRLERTEEGVFLSANVRFELPAVVEDALLKGILDVLRGRSRSAARPLVLVRPQVATSHAPHAPVLPAADAPLAPAGGPSPISNTGLGVTLGQNFDTLDEAMGAVQRISRWKDCRSRDIEPGARHNVDFRFRLDVSQLPRPFQIGAVGQPDWRISAARNQRLVVESGAVTPRTPEPAGTARFSLQTSRALRWALGLGVAAMAVIGVVLLFLLTLATNNRELYERNYALAVRHQRGGGRGCCCWSSAVDRRAAGAAAAPGQVWQPPAGQAGGHLCAGGLACPAC
jgi:hypothetical protein